MVRADGGISTSTVTSVVAATASTSLLAAKATRTTASVLNEAATANLYLKLGAAATLGSYTCKLAPGGYFELPYAAGGCYTGPIDGIWDGTDGAARITEVG